MPSITAKYMLDGTIGGFYLWDPIKLGYVTYYAAKYFAEGKIQGKPGDQLHHREGQVARHLHDPAEPRDHHRRAAAFTEENFKDYPF